MNDVLDSYIPLHTLHPRARYEAPRYLQLIVEVVDGAYAGSDYYREAWEMIKLCVREQRDLSGEELERIDELIDRGQVDLYGGEGLWVDFTKGDEGRIYK